MDKIALLKFLKIEGYRPFKELTAELKSLEVIAGANGTGKSSFFEFLKFLRDSLYNDIPPEIIRGSAGQQIFHNGELKRFSWELDVLLNGKQIVKYSGELMGPVGNVMIAFEKVSETNDRARKKNGLLLDVKAGMGIINEYNAKPPVNQALVLKRTNQLALSAVTNPAFATLYPLREYIRSWKFYGSYNINHNKIRQSVPVEQEPVLYEDAGNLSSVLHYLVTEHHGIFEELCDCLRMAVPGFKNLHVKARGGPGEVIAFWEEDGIDNLLSLADVSDGILRLLCWFVLCLQPNPPMLICIDEPDQGVHPRTLPVLASLIEKASLRTQILVATHSSYFLMQFGLNNIAVIRKKKGEAKFIKPISSKIMRANLDDFGTEEIELMHRNDELEQLS